MPRTGTSNDLQARDAKIKALEHAVRDAQPTPEDIAQMVSEHQHIRDAAVQLIGTAAALNGQSIGEKQPQGRGSPDGRRRQGDERGRTEGSVRGHPDGRDRQRKRAAQVRERSVIDVGVRAYRLSFASLSTILTSSSALAAWRSA